MAEQRNESRSFEDTRIGMEALYGPLSERQVEMLARAYTDGRIHAARSEITPLPAVVRDAERYRVVREIKDWSYNMKHAATPEEFDAAVDRKETL